MITTLTSTHSYLIEFHEQFLEDEKILIQDILSLGSKFAIITHDTLSSLYGHQLHHFLCRAGLKGFLFSFPGGEHYKTRAMKEKLENQMFEKGLGKDTCLIAMGGGVVTDLAGYLASTYCRGIPLILIPTSLLGMVDASIGGKTGVNLPYGKNMIGSIYQPHKVLIFSSFLKSLPLRELKNGFVEMIKHGLVGDLNHFEFLEKSADQLLSLTSPLIKQAIIESCYIKKEIVEQDEKEKGKRHLLNFGHTIGHALEIFTNHLLSHGEAVAIGILAESYMATELGYLDKESFQSIQNILSKYRLPMQLPFPLSTKTLLQSMKLDKKSIEDKPRFVILQKIGSPLVDKKNYCHSIEEPFIEKTIQWMNHALRCH